MERPVELRAICQSGKESDPAWYAIHRRVSIYLTWLLLHTRVTPNQITLAMMGVAAAGAWLLAFEDLRWNLAGFALLYLSFLLDKCDGEVARYRNAQSFRGVLLDRIHHLAIEPAIVFAAAWREYQATGSPGLVIVALVAIVLGNVLEEQPHWPAYALMKQLREGRRLPAVRPDAASWSVRAYPLFRALKAFRMFVVVLGSLALVYVAQWMTGRPVVAAYLIAMLAAVGAYLVFQSYYYYAFKLESEIASYRPHVVGSVSTDVPPTVEPRASAPRSARNATLGTRDVAIERTTDGLRSST